MRPLLLVLLLASALFADPSRSFDVIVYGASPAGIMTAVAAAREGRSVALVEYHRHVGGMTASGLGKSDVENRAAVGGLFKEFADRVHQHYVEMYGKAGENTKLSRDGYYYEPHVAERVFQAMLRESGRVQQYLGHELIAAVREGKRLAAIRARSRDGAEAIELRAKVFADATYEGDLAAMAGAPYRLGRESRKDFNELHAGVVYQDYETRTFLAGTTGEGDKRVQAYTFRLCLTTNKANAAPLTAPPPDYQRERYLGYFDDWKAGRLGETKDAKPGRGYFAPTFGTMVRALSMAEIPNGKLDINMNPRPLGFPFAELNYEYPEADWAKREQIIANIRNITLGVLYFLQNDAEVPMEHRALANRFHLAKDEFTDSGNFPWQLYVREARRIVGDYTFSEHDVVPTQDLGRPPIHTDSIAAGEFPIDSFPVRRREPGDRKALEGYILMLDQLTRAYQLPYRILLPQEVEGLIVPTAVSATHVAFSTIRMEPLWMVLGQAAGLAAHMAIDAGSDYRAISVERLQSRLLGAGQVLTYFDDLDPKHPAHLAAQHLGTKGYFPGFEAKLGDAVTAEQAAQWLTLLHKDLPSVPVPSFVASTSLTRGSFNQWAAQVKLAALPIGSDAITRGELCQWIYQRYQGN